MGLSGARSHIQHFSASAVPVVYRENVSLAAGGIFISEVVTTSGLPVLNVWVSSTLAITVTPQFALGNNNQGTPVPNWQPATPSYLTPAVNVPSLVAIKPVAARYRVVVQNTAGAAVNFAIWIGGTIS